MFDFFSYGLNKVFIRLRGLHDYSERSLFLALGGLAISFLTLKNTKLSISSVK